MVESNSRQRGYEGYRTRIHVRLPVPNQDSCAGPSIAKQIDSATHAKGRRSSGGCGGERIRQPGEGNVSVRDNEATR
ncbi:hypothetical protein PMIN01_04536 [Paraphaeosphaeria minitans]|uniref:Uncharacterized protein n=1 Tax=Paraphaeosphaeria minitans TaxID=565426 RepID=A0A9P6GJ94_9PLEO|nr:hypothetical protein PMIN01_04536 [Paraphaeosphaeria minitans]